MVGFLSVYDYSFYITYLLFRVLSSVLRPSNCYSMEFNCHCLLFLICLTNTCDLDVLLPSLGSCNFGLPLPSSTSICSDDWSRDCLVVEFLSAIDLDVNVSRRVFDPSLFTLNLFTDTTLRFFRLV